MSPSPDRRPGFDPLGVGQRVPERGVREPGPAADLVQPEPDLLRSQDPGGDDRLARSLEDADQVLDHRVEELHAGAGSEEEHRAGARSRPGPGQEPDELAPDPGVHAPELVLLAVGAPKPGESMRIRPHAQGLVVVVHEHDPAAGTRRAHQHARGLERAGQVLEQEARVHEIEALPFRLRKRRGERVPGSQLHVREPPGTPGRRRELVLVALDRQDRPARQAGGQRPREQPHPSPHLERPLVAPGSDRRELALVQDRVHQPQARLLRVRGAVDVARFVQRAESSPQGMLAALPEQIAPLGGP